MFFRKQIVYNRKDFEVEGCTYVYKYIFEPRWERFVVLHDHGDILVETKDLDPHSKVVRSWNMNDRVIIYF
jgi:hypothetical protein